jgi:hypothetical protein
MDSTFENQIDIQPVWLTFIGDTLDVYTDAAEDAGTYYIRVTGTTYQGFTASFDFTLVIKDNPCKVAFPSVVTPIEDDTYYLT